MVNKLKIYAIQCDVKYVNTRDYPKRLSYIREGETRATLIRHIVARNREEANNKFRSKKEEIKKFYNREMIPHGAEVMISTYRAEPIHIGGYKISVEPLEDKVNSI